MIRIVAYVWMIVIGGLLFIPGRPPQCLVCGAPFDIVAIAVSIVLGAAGLYTEIRSGGAMKR